uniref:Uncharacterized protein n=1 Tax=Leersia perrieri TaxID=77586 RepID=A0A0D9XYS0_9ORYZ
MAFKILEGQEGTQDNKTMRKRENTIACCALLSADDMNHGVLRRAIEPLGSAVCIRHHWWLNDVDWCKVVCERLKTTINNWKKESGTPTGCVYLLLRDGGGDPLQIPRISVHEHIC